VVQGKLAADTKNGESFSIEGSFYRNAWYPFSGEVHVRNFEPVSNQLYLNNQLYPMMQQMGDCNNSDQYPMAPIGQYSMMGGNSMMPMMMGQNNTANMEMQPVGNMEMQPVGNM